MLKIKEIGSFNGSPRYYVNCDEKIEVVEKIHSKLVDNDREELFCESTNVEGVYYFGCKQLFDSYDHKAGYVWSSCPGCINGAFGTQLVEAVIDGVGYWYIDINILKSLVEEFTGKQYKIEKHFWSYDKNQEEPCYKLVEIEV